MNHLPRPAISKNGTKGVAKGGKNGGTKGGGKGKGYDAQPIAWHCTECAAEHHNDYLSYCRLCWEARDFIAAPQDHGG